MEITEPKASRFYRGFLKFLIVWGSIFSFIMIIAGLIKHILISIIGVVLFILLITLYRRVGRVRKIEDDAVEVEISGREILVPKQDIAWIASQYMVLSSRSAWLLIKFKSKIFRFLNCAIVPNEPEYSFLKTFHEMGIKIKNVYDIENI